MDALSTTGGLFGPAVKGVWLMREIATVLAKFDIVLGTILFLCTVIKWYVLKARIEANGWKSMNPCEVMTLIMYTIPVFGQMCFLALMTTLDEGAARKREEAGRLQVACQEILGQPEEFPEHVVGEVDGVRRRCDRIYGGEALFAGEGCRSADMEVVGHKCCGGVR